MTSFSRTFSDPHYKNGPHQASGAAEIAAEAKERLIEVGEAALKGMGGAGEMVRDVVANRPMLALGTALAVGVVIGWLIKRR